MATYVDRGEATYGGLLQQTYAAIVVGTVCLTLVESLRRVPRRRGRGRVARDEPIPAGDTTGLTPHEIARIESLGSRENWTHAYLYMARCWAAVPSPRQPKWPLAWIWQVLRTSDETFLRLSGVDATVYTRFLRACFYFAALHTCTTLVVILPIHYRLGSVKIKQSDINRVSLTTLVNGLDEVRADKILWVHMVMVIWITVSWLLLLTWFVLGSLRYRAYAARHVLAPASTIKRFSSLRQSHDNTSSFPSAAYTSGTPFGPLHPEPAPTRSFPTDEGGVPDYSLRCRTVMVTNIPQNLRTPEMLRWYFARYLPDSSPPKDPSKDKSKPWRKFKSAVLPHKVPAPPVELARPRRSKSGNRKLTQERERGHILDAIREAMAHELEMTRDEVAMVEARGRAIVEKVVLAPKLSTLARLIAERETRMEELEEAHILLARTVMGAVGKEMDRRQREEGRKVREGEIRRRERLRAETGSKQASDGEDGGGWIGAVRDTMVGLGSVFERIIWGEPDHGPAMDKLVQVIGPFVEEARQRDAQYGVRLALKSIWARLGVSPNRAGGKQKEKPSQTSPDSEGKSTYNTVWSALYDLEAEYLRPYQPLIRRRSILLYPLELIGILAPTGLPATDLAFLRIRSLQKRIEELKACPLPDASEKKSTDKVFIEEPAEDDLPNGDAPHISPVPGGHTIEPASSAFVTFRRWQDARRAVRVLSHRPGRPLTCLVVMAPQTTDLDWERLVKGKFAAQFVRDWLVGAAIWLFQVFWIFPISFITSLISLKSLEAVIPPMARFFDHNPRARALITGLIPTLLVAGLGILIPVILFVIGRKAQTEVTFSGLHNGILIRYYKWLILNIVIFFCIGLSSFQTFLEAFRKHIPDPFQLVSSSFPAAAPFYAGWFILQTTLQNLMQFGLVGLPLITYVFGVRTASTPRKRKRGTQPRTIDYHYWTPNHLLAMHIITIFAVLNPLVVPFGLIYYAVANVVFRNQLLRVYARRFYEGNGNMLTIRVLRYSMDGLALSHIVFLAFNLLNFNRARAGVCGTLFGITLLLKVVATREFRARYEKLERAESARLCGDDEPFSGEERSQSGEERRSVSVAASHAPLAPERQDTFPPSVDSNPSSSLSWNFPGLKPFGHGYNVSHVRGHPLRGRIKHKSPPLSRITSRTGSQVEIMRADSPASTETNGAALTRPTTRTRTNPLVLVQQVGQVPGMLLELVTAKSSRDSDLGGINYLCGTQPSDIVVPAPKLGRWDDTPDGSASYECPYYLDEGPECIWLPRDPAGPVDLDDTVSMYRLLLSVHDRDMPSNDKASVENQSRRADSEKIPSPQSSINRPPMREENSEKSLAAIPFTLSPIGTPQDEPVQSPHSPHTTPPRPTIIRTRTASVDQAVSGSPQSHRHSVSDAMEMRSLQAPPQTSSTLEATAGSGPSRPPLRRQPSLLSAFRTWRSKEAPDLSGSVFSYKTALDGGESRQNSDKRRSRALAPDEVRRALDATVQAEEKAEKARKDREEQAEKLDDARVEQEESGGWSLVKKLVLKRNTEQ